MPQSCMIPSIASSSVLYASSSFVSADISATCSASITLAEMIAAICASSTPIATKPSLIR